MVLGERWHRHPPLSILSRPRPSHHHHHLLILLHLAHRPQPLILTTGAQPLITPQHQKAPHHHLVVLVLLDLHLRSAQKAHS